VGFVDGHRDRFGGVEPICRVLTGHGCPIDPSTCHHFEKRPVCARSVRDAELGDLIVRVRGEDFGVYGVREVWREPDRRGEAVARCTVERLMRGLGLSGAVRGRKVRTTIPDPSAERAPDLVKRNFVASAPNRCRVADFTHVPAYAGTVHVAFVVDAFSRRIVGWSAATTEQTPLVLGALETGLWRRDRAGHDRSGLVHHSDAGSRGGFNWSLQHLEHGGAGWDGRRAG
jgi:putative transposase